MKNQIKKIRDHNLETKRFNISKMEDWNLLISPKIQTKALWILLLFIPILSAISCKKEIAIPPPTQAVVTSVLFADSTAATSAIDGIYVNMYSANNIENFGGGGTTYFCGASADELVTIDGLIDFYTNSLNAATATTNNLWETAYNLIYQTNVCIDNLQSSASLSTATRNQLTGEAKFLRAYCYFYLVNLYGGVPLALSSNYKVNQVLSRSTVAQGNAQIISDLLSAQSLLRSDYSISGGERIRANKAAATALLAREYLYTSQWAKADSAASVLINNTGTYRLVQSLNNVFLANSTEAILQLQINSAVQPFNATNEGYYFSGFNVAYINQPLLSAFENGDQRKVDWTDSIDYPGYYLPYKYKIGVNNYAPNGPVTEYYMLLRLSEQYLIRSEAEAHGVGSGVSGAINDLNVIRNRAGLPNYKGSAQTDSVLNAIYHENQIEFCFEWGHRWLDLRRTGRINAVMSVATPEKGGNAWQPNQALYPIPYSDKQTDPYLTQNPGY